MEQDSEMFCLKSREDGVCCWPVAALGSLSTSSLLPHGLIKVLRERVSGAPSKKPLVCGAIVSGEAIWQPHRVC